MNNDNSLDQGGPKREYWRLLAIDIMTKLCTGSDQRLTFEHDVLGLQVSAKILKTPTHTPIKQSITLIKQSITLIKQNTFLPNIPNRTLVFLIQQLIFNVHINTTVMLGALFPDLPTMQLYACYVDQMHILVNVNYRDGVCTIVDDVM